jgi:hypothetical protein
MLVAIPGGIAGLLPYERSCGGAHMTIGNRDGDLLIMMRDGGARHVRTPCLPSATPQHVRTIDDNVLH